MHIWLLHLKVISSGYDVGGKLKLLIYSQPCLKSKAWSVCSCILNNHKQNRIFFNWSIVDLQDVLVSSVHDSD